MKSDPDTTTQGDKTTEKDQPQLESQAVDLPASPPRTPNAGPSEITRHQSSQNHSTCFTPGSMIGEPAPNESSENRDSRPPPSPKTAETTAARRKYKRAKELTRDERIGIQYLREYGGFTYEEIFLRCGRRFTMRQIQDACTGPATPRKKGRRK
ncbi:hypothetical protein QBC44DRAFT_399662 [Cladorrhinum sp. PSN332]|nr:hypothetical protein QBC44DRAFT_399662 [Cladorrhinum sp. PSN332]